MNYSVLIFGLYSDLFGIIFSVLFFIFGSQKTNLKVNYLLLFLIFLFEFISFRLHTKSLHFLSLLLFVCLIFHQFTKKFSFIAFICILLFSSIFNKFFEHLTSEIKQSLCHIVYVTLGDLLHIDRIEGVNFFIKDSKITIDTACMGLSMFKTGLLTGGLLLTFEEKKQKYFFSILQIVGFCFTIIVLNVISNYFRIVTLIIFNCTQENTLHYSVGLLCFAFYQVLPMIFIIKYIKPKISEELPRLIHQKTLSSLKLKEYKNYFGFFLMFVIISITSLEIKNPQNDDLLVNLNPKYNLDKGSWFNKEVFKIETPEALIYIKTPSHKPLICWIGDGYIITESKEITINNEKIWFVKMEKNKVQYKSIWWYECGNKKYTSFVEVMFMKLIYNDPIRLINETSKL